jgi:S1-C subfamily serine protease
MEVTEDTDNQTAPQRKRVGARIAAVAGAVAIGAATGAGAVMAIDANGESSASATASAPTTRPAAITSGGLTAEQIYESTAAGVVDITVTGTKSSQAPFDQSGGTQSAEGSGFVLDTRGNIVTNYHVVEGGSSYKVTFQDGSTAKATLVGTDQSTDLAVVHVDVADSLLHPLDLADSDNVSPGEPVVAIGSPFGLADTITAGIVSALNRRIEAPNGAQITGAIQTDAAINHGNSGGPLIDGAGKVIGVNSQIDSESGGSDGVGFAVPSNTVERVTSLLIAGKKVEHAYLGVTPVTVTSTAASELDLPAGVQLSSVEPSSPAAKAGLSAGSGSRMIDGLPYTPNGDVIVKVDGKAVTTADDLRSAIDAKQPGDIATLTVVRSGKERTVSATLTTRPS